MNNPHTEAASSSTKWPVIRRLYPIYAALAREFVIDYPIPGELESGSESSSPELLEQAQQWLTHMDEQVQVHQLRQFLQTSSLIDPDGIVALLQHLLAIPLHTDAMRDKIDFLLVQYFSQVAPTDLTDERADLVYVANALEPILGAVELAPPVWLKTLDRVLETARKCRSLDELLHGGVLEQGRKAKGQAGELFYMPVSLVSFTRFGYLMRRSFFRLMLADLNKILEGLSELEQKGVETIDCRRAQFSAQEPISRLRMICQSWKVMFQAEYSSGQPLRMLVELRASVETALGRGQKTTVASKPEVKSATPGDSAVTKPGGAASSSPANKARAATAAAATRPSAIAAVVQKTAQPKAIKPKATSTSKMESSEFEISAAPEWNPEPES